MKNKRAIIIISLIPMFFGLTMIFFLILADTQLFVLAPLLIYPLWKHKRAGLQLLIVLAIVSVVVPFYITYTQNLDPTFIVWPRYE